MPRLLSRAQAASGCAVLLALALAPPGARAQDEPPTRSVESVVHVTPADAPCLGGLALAERVARLLGTAQVDAALSIEVGAGGAGGEDVGFVVLRDGRIQAHRDFPRVPAGCDARLDAVGLAIALAVDHTVLDRLGETAHGAAPAAQTAAQPSGLPPNGSPPAGPAAAPGAPRAESEPARARATSAGRPGLRWGLFAGGGLLLGVAGGLAPGADLGLDLAFDPGLRALLSAHLAPPQEEALGRGSVSTSLLAARLGLCVDRAAGPLLVSGCGAAWAGLQRSAGRGFPIELTATEPWVAAAAGASARFPARGGLGLRLGADLLLSLLRPRVHVEGYDGAILAEREGPLLGAHFSLCLHWRLP